jgi:carbonic anhydrase
MDAKQKTKPVSGREKPDLASERPKAEKLVKTKDPKEVLSLLMQGNKRYMEGKLLDHDVKEKREETLSGQEPLVTVVACSDSRVVPEYIFDTNLEEIFSIQTAGNIVDEITIGSIEYGVAHAGTPVLMIMGHEKCGAVTACIDGAREGNITAIMEKIEPGIEDVPREGDADHVVTECAKANVKAVISELLEKSETIRNLVDEGKLKVVGAMYYLTDGRVDIIA